MTQFLSEFRRVSLSLCLYFLKFYNYESLTKVDDT